MSNWYVIDPDDTDYRCVGFMHRPTSAEILELANDWDIGDGEDLIVAYRVVTFEVGHSKVIWTSSVASLNEAGAATWADAP